MKQQRMMWRQLTWVFVVSPIVGGVSGCLVAYVTFIGVSAEPMFAVFHGGPAGVILGFLYGLLAVPFVAFLGIKWCACVLVVGVFGFGLLPALAGNAPVALLGSMLGGLISLCVLALMSGAKICLKEDDGE